MEFKLKLFEVMQLRQLSLKQLAKASGVRYDTLRSYLKPESQRIPTAPNGVAIAKALEVPAEWLFDDNQGFPPPLSYRPPFPIDPWPPTISWEEVQAGIALYLLRRNADIRASLGRNRAGPIDSKPHRLDHLTSLLGLYCDNLQETKLARELIETDPVAGKWFRRFVRDIFTEDPSTPESKRDWMNRVHRTRKRRRSPS